MSGTCTLEAALLLRRYLRSAAGGRGCVSKVRTFASIHNRRYFGAHNRTRTLVFPKGDALPQK
jgi:hypothetical protein